MEKWDSASLFLRSNLIANYFVLCKHDYGNHVIIFVIRLFIKWYNFSPKMSIISQVQTFIFLFFKDRHVIHLKKKSLRGTPTHLCDTKVSQVLILGLNIFNKCKSIYCKNKLKEKWCSLVEGQKLKPSLFGSGYCRISVLEFCPYFIRFIQL